VRVLIIEDEKRLAEAIAFTLELSGRERRQPVSTSKKTSTSSKKDEYTHKSDNKPKRKPYSQSFFKQDTKEEKKKIIIAKLKYFFAKNKIEEITTKLNEMKNKITVTSWLDDMLIPLICSSLNLIGH